MHEHEHEKFANIAISVNVYDSTYTMYGSL